jgi:hypothetical protein
LLGVTMNLCLSRAMMAIVKEEKKTVTANAALKINFTNCNLNIFV